MERVENWSDRSHLTLEATIKEKKKSELTFFRTLEMNQRLVAPLEDLLKRKVIYPQKDQ